VLLSDGGENNRAAPGNTTSPTCCVERAGRWSRSAWLERGPPGSSGSALSGGTASFPLEATALDGGKCRVLEALRQRCVVGCTSTNPTRDGAWRNGHAARPTA
jgi:hypothetical protein